MQMDLLADTLSHIKNCDRVGKKECIVRYSKLVENVLKVMKKNGYIKDYEVFQEGKFKKIKVYLSNRIVNCNAIKPRFPCPIEEILKFEKRYLPSKNIGILIISTSKGIMDHREARANNIGGVLLAYAY